MSAGAPVPSERAWFTPLLEGHSIDVSGLPAGDYELEHRANGDRGRVDLFEQCLLRARAHDRPRGNDRRPELDLLKRCPQRERWVR